MLIIHGCVLMFAILGIVFIRGKGSFLIAGYNTASSEEKARYDEKALCRVMGGMMFSCAACFVVMALSEVFQTIVLLWVGLSAFFLVIIASVIYMNTSKKVKRK